MRLKASSPVVFLSTLTMFVSHSRQEVREGQQRPVNKDYYYIDHHATIDAIKYRIFQLTNTVKDLYKPSEEKKDYHCPRCKAQWTQLEVLDKISSSGEFQCHRCNGILERDDVSAADSAGHERQAKLMQQLEKLLKLMPQIDSQTIPNNDFETAFSLMVPIQRNEEVNPVRKFEPLEKGRGPPTAVKGLANTVSQPIEIDLTTSSEKTAAEQAAEAKRKADIAAQNIMPVWHTNSTVTGESTIVSDKDGRLGASSSNLGAFKEEDEDKKGVDIQEDDEVTKYYAQLEQEKAREAAEEAETDDEDDEFEDVDVGGGPSGAATPSSSMSGAVNGLTGKGFSSPNGTNNRIKRESPDSGSSAPGTGVSTPAPESEGVSPAKRVKLETNGSGLAKSTAVNLDSDEDEEVEFEDV